MVAVALLGMAALGACQSPIADEPEGGDTDSRTDVSEVTPGQTTDGGSTLRRAVLVYQVASKSGLDALSYNDLKEMTAGSAAGAIPADCRLIVYNHSFSDPAVLMNIHAGVRDTLKVYPEGSSVLSSRMREVFSDFVTAAPADDYGLILWGHGSGWLQDGISDPTAGLPNIVLRSYGGENRKDWMNITTLAENVAAGPDFSFVYFDCCHMASVEVAYEMRKTTPVIAGSVAEIAGEGMPYHITLPYFFSDGDADIVGAARANYNYYEEWRISGNRPECSPASFSSRYTCMSVIDTSALDALADAARYIYSQTPVAYPDGFSPQKFGRYSLAGYYFDLRQYVAALCLSSSGTELFTGATSALAEFDGALARAVPYEQSMSKLYGGSVTMSYHCGLSTFITKTPEAYFDSNNYADLAWYGNVASQLPF